MKTVKHLSVLLSVLLVVSLLVVGFVVNADEPAVITVTNEEEFNAAMVEANAAATIELANDITLTNGNTTMPGNFTGTFDGKDHTISGLTAPIFSGLNGTFKNVTLNGAIESTERVVGSVAKESRNGGIIENVVSNVDIVLTAGDINAGGILGYAKKVVIKNATYAGELTVNWNGNGAGIAGIVGWSSIGSSDTSEYIDCTFSGKITVNETAGSGNTGSISAILGLAKGGKHVITRAINAGELAVNTGGAGYNWFGGIVAAFENAGDSVISGSLVDPKSVLVNGNPNTQRQFYAKATGTTVTAHGAFHLADGSWIADDGEGFAAVLAAMPADAIVSLAADVTLPDGTPTYTKGDFAGTIDGQNHTVSGLTNTMFKKIVGGTVKNITFEGTIDYVANTPVIEVRKASTLAGDAKNVTLENVTSNVDIKTAGEDLNAGGLLGYANEATFTNCTYGGTYTATWTGAKDGAVGGIVGYIRTNSGTNVYTNCAFTGTINVDGAVEGKNMFVGGIIGKHRQNDVQFVDVSNTGVINTNTTAGNVFVGGFLGQNQDCASVTMSGLYDGTINAPGATVDNFLANDNAGTANTDGCKVPAKFDAGTIALDKDGAFLLGTDSYAAFLSVRDGATEGTSDYRFVIVADGDAYKAGTDVKLVLTFTKDGAAVKTLTKTFAELELYAKATAAGNAYAAAEGCFLTGVVVTGVPADAWDTVTVAVVDGETDLAVGKVAYADIAEQTLYTITEDTVELYSTGGVNSIAIETHHAANNNNPTFVICLYGDETVAAIYQDIYNKDFNPNYTWYISVNDGAEFVPPSFSAYDGETWGYLRAELGADYFDLSSYDITLVIVDNATREAVYYGEFYIHNDFIYDENKPEDIAVIAPEDITVKGGPDIGGDEGADKAFDGDHSTKICTGSDGADNALIVELKNTFNLKGVGLCNANDNEGSEGRTVLDFEIYVSADGENWGEAVYVATGEGKDKADYSTNFMEIYYDFTEIVEAKFVKIVVNNGELYQLSEVLLYQSTGTFMPENHLNFYFEQSNQDGSKNLVYWFHDNFGGDATVAKIANGEYLLDLVIDGIEYKNAPATAAGRYLLVNIEALGVKGIKAGNYYDCSLTVNDKAGNRVYYNDPFSAGNYQRKDGCPYDLVPPAAIEVSSYGIENHHADINNHAAWVINTGDLALATGISEGTYTVVLMIDGVKTPVVNYSLYGTNWVRFDLETAGITGIVRGTKLTLQAIVYDADGYAVYETAAFEETSNVFSSDIPAQNVTLPTTGLKEQTVNKETLSYEGIGVWNEEKESIAQLFDGNTSTTKMGGNVEDARTVTLYFSLNAPATVTYYTFYSGNDTDIGSTRNPKDWTLYGKVGEEWVVLSAVGFDAPTGMQAKRATPFNYAVTNLQECTEYKLVLTTEGQFQLNELKLFAADATVTAPTAPAIIGAAGAEVVLVHRNDWLKNEEGAAQFGLATKGDGNYFPNADALATIVGKPAYVYIKDVTNGSEYVKYNVINLTTARHCDIRFDAEGFTPAEGVVYDIILIVNGGEGTRYGEATYAIPSWGFQLGVENVGF